MAARTPVAANAPPLSGPGRQFFPVTPVSATTLNLTLTAMDATNFNVTPITEGRLYLLVTNPDTGAHTLTIHSVADAQNRTGDITAYSIGAGAIAFIGPFTNAGWGQPVSPGPAGLWYDSASALMFVSPILVPA